LRDKPAGAISLAGSGGAAGPKKFYRKFLSGIPACSNPAVLEFSPPNHPFRYGEHITNELISFKSFYFGKKCAMGERADFSERISLQVIIVPVGEFRQNCQ
jgi:hypothetical protein